MLSAPGPVPRDPNRTAIPNLSKSVFPIPLTTYAPPRRSFTLPDL
jgi:hypothetical protein